MRASSCLAPLVAGAVLASCGESVEPAPVRDVDPHRERAIADLEALGYLGGEVEDTGQAVGVTVRDAERMQPGLSFVVSAHVPGAYLMDAEGRVVQRWERAFREIWPDVELPKGGARQRAGKTTHWRRAWPLEDGDVLLVFEGLGIARLDRDSNVVWKNFDRAHHDAHVTEAGEIFVLTREAHVVERVNPDAPILEDFVELLSSEGETRRRVSVLECFENAAPEQRAVWEASARREGDLFHTNSIEILDGSAAVHHPAFTAGRALVSFRALNAIAVLDLDEARVVWTFADDFLRQHDPKLVAPDRLLLFDNGPTDGPSRVLEYALPAMKLVWSYAGSEAAPFHSVRCGAAQRLANGNTLVTESVQGRAFEVTPAGEIVWEYRNPGRVDDGAHVAQLFEVIRQ